MPQILKVNGRDLSSYIRNAHGDGLEPASADAIDPQFTGSTAIGEGQTFVGNSLGNVAMSFPLILKATDTDALYKLIRDIRGDLQKGNTLEYSSGGATASTFFDMESGKLEPDFEFFLDQRGLCRATLTIWRRPYGHTGTSRLIASGVSTGMLNVVASNLAGDIDAQAILRIGVPSGNPAGPVVAFGVKSPAPSGWSPNIGAASIAVATRWANQPAGRQLQGASGRLASQALYVGLGATANYSLDKTWALGEVALPPVTYAGRYRVFAGAVKQTYGNPKLSLGINNEVLSEAAAGGTPTSALTGLGFSFVGLATLTDRWTLRDLGEVSIPTSSASANPRLGLFLTTATNSYPYTAGASYPIGVEGLFLLPVDNSAGVYADPPRNDFVTPQSATTTASLDAVSRSVVMSYATYSVDRSGMLRGDFPSITAQGGRVVALTAGNALFNSGSDNMWVTNTQYSYSLFVRERFSYMR